MNQMLTGNMLSGMFCAFWLSHGINAQLIKLIIKGEWMNVFKKIFAGAALAAAFASSAHAGLINVGGVVFDPDYNAAGIEQDFISEFKFTQWFGSSAGSKGALDYGNAVAISKVFSSVTGASSAATGYYLQGAGRFDRINDSALNINSGIGGANTFCPSCQLTYGFGGIGLNQDNTFDVSQAWATVYVDASTVFTSPITSQAVANAAIDGTIWLDLTFNDMLLQSGTVKNGLISANFNVASGLAAPYFNPDKVAYSASAYFGPNAFTVNPNAKYSSGGNGQALGNTNPIPEPGSIALIGLGMLGAAFARRRKITN